MKPDDIPDDVLALAEDAYLDAVVMTTHDEPKAMVIMLARAILAERARWEAELAQLVDEAKNVVECMDDGGLSGANIDLIPLRNALWRFNRPAETKKPDAMTAPGPRSRTWKR